MNPDGPVQALESARVDLVDIIRRGVPERHYVPGCSPYLIAGKRYLVPASAGTGKTLGAIVIAVEIVANGGAVAVVDVENGPEEYASRLQDVLGDRGELAAACGERLRYYAWPTLRTDWDAGEWSDALSGADLVVFDSSRLILSGAGLVEDSNDDYAQFVNGLLIPLSRAGIATLVLDNTGHEGERARGASSKSDLNEVVYVAVVTQPFDRDQTGELQLHRRRTRFSGIPEKLTMTLGGGTYTAPIPVVSDCASRAAKSGRDLESLIEPAVRYIEQHPEVTRRDDVAKGLEVAAAVGRKVVALAIEQGRIRERATGGWDVIAASEPSQTPPDAETPGEPADDVPASETPSGRRDGRAQAARRLGVSPLKGDADGDGTSADWEQLSLNGGSR